jgi:hypothetical protein
MKKIVAHRALKISGSPKNEWQKGNLKKKNAGKTNTPYFWAICFTQTLLWQEVYQLCRRGTGQR